MSNQELNLFKDEILKRIREVETKFFKELSKKNFEININYENFSEKVNSILESNRLMIESITNHKIQFEKINKLELNTNEIENRLTTLDIRINNSMNEIKKMKFNYDKIISENLIIPAYIGPGSMYKSLGEFIVNSIEEFKQFKEQKEKIFNSNIELKEKMDLINKNLTNFVEFNISRCKAYTDSKEKEYQLKLDDKFKQFDEKSIETNKHIYSNQIQFEEKLKEIGEKIGQISTNSTNKNKKEINLLIFDKFEEIKKKEEEMNEKLQKTIKEVKELKLMKKELTEQMKNINLKIEDLNKISILKNSSQNKNKTNKEIFNSNKKNYLNSFGNIFYNSNNNITNLNNQKNSSRKNDLPNLSNIVNPLSQNNLGIKEKKQIFRNERRPSILNYNSKTEEEVEGQENIIKVKNNEDTNLKENNTFRKSTTNINTKLDNKNIDIKKDKIENTALSHKDYNNSKLRIKEKIYQNSTNDLKLNSKNKNQKLIFDREMKEYFLDKKHHINLEFNKNNKEKSIINEIEKFGKTGTEYFLKTPNNIKIKYEISKPFINKQKKIQNTFIQTNKIDNNNNKIIKKEILNNVNIEGNDIFVNSKNIPITEGNINAIDCNVINLNLLDLPNNKHSNITSLNNYLEKSFQNKSKSIKSVDSKTQVKVSPIFGRTGYAFYNIKDTGKKNGNLYSSD